MLLTYRVYDADNKQGEENTDQTTKMQVLERKKGSKEARKEGFWGD